MKEEQIMQRAEAFARQIEGCELMEAVDVLGQGLVIASKKKPEHALVAIYYIGKLISEMHGRSALVKIQDDGTLSFSIGANGVEQKLF